MARVHSCSGYSNEMSSTEKCRLKYSEMKAPKIYIFLGYPRKCSQTIYSTGFDATSLTLPSL